MSTSNGAAKSSHVLRSDLFATLPSENLDLAITIKSGRKKIVVLDDDPTGTQTVHGIPVVTQWTVNALRAELENDLPAFYILTNSRSRSLDDALRITKEIGHNLVRAARQVHREFAVVSRSDSTLRGHFPR